jgi:polysaccharide export outer membrane protein
MGIDILRVDDKLTLALTDIPAPYVGLEVRIRADGTITLPLGVTLTAAGKRTGDLEREIVGAYVPKYFVRLTANVKTEDRVFYVGGYVRAPGRYVFAGEMTVLGAIKVAGDFTEYANQRKVELTRSDKTKKVLDCKKIRRNPKLDPAIYPGDSIYVPQRLL